MNRRPVVMVLGQIIGDMTDALEAIQQDKIGVALAKLELVSARLRDASRELRAL